MDRGTIELFMGAKLAVAVAAMCLVGIVISWGSAVFRSNERDELGSVADAISASILDVQAIPPCTSITRGLPAPGFEFRAEIAAESENVLRILVSGKSKVEKRVYSMCGLEQGAVADNPKFIELERGEKLRLRLIS